VGRRLVLLKGGQGLGGEGAEGALVALRRERLEERDRVVVAAACAVM